MPRDATADAPTDMPWPRARAVAAQFAGQRAAERPSVEIAVAAAAGHVVARDIHARTDLPAFDTAAMDGWAVVGAPPWRVVGEARAGGRSRSLGGGEAVRISTGAAVPQGAGVLRSERGDEHGGNVRLLPGCQPPTPGSDSRATGEEVHSGELILRAGTVVTPPAIGLAAAAGLDVLTVVPLPTVSVLVLGDELVDAGVPGPGQVRDALSPQLPGWVTALHGRIEKSARVTDSLHATARALEAATTDLIITTGGTARGQADHVQSALERLGGRWLVNGVAVRPGHPMKLGQLPDGRLWVALPGNPLAAVSALVSLGEPLLAKLSGRPDVDRAEAQVRRPLAHPIECSPSAHRLIPATIAGGLVHPTLRRGPAMLTGLASADVLAVATPGPERLDPGADVRVLPLPWGSGLVA